MYKKLLVFSLTFCLGLLSFQLSNQYKATPLEQEVFCPFIENDLPQFASSDSPKDFTLSNLEDNHRFGIAGVKTDKEVKDFYLKFQKAIAEDDKNTVASLMIYPLRVNFPVDNPKKEYTFINNKKSFLKKYNKIFDKRLKEFIAQIDVENDKDFWAKDDGITTRHGEIWIGVFCNRNLCEDDKYHINIRTIHGNSIFLRDKFK